jgi:hypothetical protein
MKNRGYEYEIFDHFFGFLILKLLESQILEQKDTPFIFFYRLECMHGPKIVKKSEKKQKPKIYEYICTCMNIKKNIDVFLLSQ